MLLPFCVHTVRTNIKTAAEANTRRSPVFHNVDDCWYNESIPYVRGIHYPHKCTKSRRRRLSIVWCSHDPVGLCSFYCCVMWGRWGGRTKECWWCCWCRKLLFDDDDDDEDEETTANKMTGAKEEVKLRTSRCCYCREKIASFQVASGRAIVAIRNRGKQSRLFTHGYLQLQLVTAEQN